MSTVEDLTRDYRTGFLRYLPHRSESAMTAGYELGRRAARSGSSLLDLVQAHHRVLGEVLTEEPPPDTPEVMAAACEYFSEVLSTFEMAHRAVHDRAAKWSPEP
jgi:hypothetical protein